MRPSFAITNLPALTNSVLTPAVSCAGRSDRCGAAKRTSRRQLDCIVRTRFLHDARLAIQWLVNVERSLMPSLRPAQDKDSRNEGAVCAPKPGRRHTTLSRSHQPRQRTTTLAPYQPQRSLRPRPQTKDRLAEATNHAGRCRCLYTPCGLLRFDTTVCTASILMAGDRLKPCR